jgi:rRNA-processing protein EBP2
MAKKNKSRNSKKVKQIEDEVMEEEPQEEMELGNKRVTLEEIDAMSDGEEEEIEEWNAEAKALRQAIADGAFDKIKLSKTPQDEDMEEVAEDGSSEEEEDVEEQELEEEQEQRQQHKPKPIGRVRNMKALTAVTSDLLNEKAALPWAEKLDIIPATPLPFGQLTEEGLPIHVHDDLKREVAFYNLALEAVHVARKQSENLNVPFSRPEDFFAEMVKTDGKCTTPYICAMMAMKN